jgi:hypothetical protein
MAKKAAKLMKLGTPILQEFAIQNKDKKLLLKKY